MEGQGDFDAEEADYLHSRNLWAFCTRNQDLIPDILEKSKDPVQTGKSLLLQIFWELEQEVEDPDSGMDDEPYTAPKSSKSSSQFKLWIDNLVFNNGRNRAMTRVRVLFETSYQMVAFKQKEMNAIRNTILKLTNGHQGLMEICGVDGAQNPDGFMYKDLKDFETKTGTKSLAKCLDCGSNNTKLISLISHSCSFEALQQLFTLRLNDLKEKKVLDIGSGMGSILYAAYCLTEASQITGIELNEMFCGMVSNIITKYGMDRNNRMKVVHGDLKDFPGLVQESDVVIFNNSFEYFVPRDVQVVLWQFIKANLKQGSIIVTNPSLLKLLSPLQPELGFVVTEWVAEFGLPPGEEGYQKSVALTVIPKPDESFYIYNVI